jgi:hypothetical protein
MPLVEVTAAMQLLLYMQNIFAGRAQAGKNK